MNNFKRGRFMKVKFIIFVLIYSINLFAQEYALKAVSEDNNDTEFAVSVRIKMEKPEDSNLGNATIRFSYDPHELQFPDLPSEGIDYLFNLNSMKQYSCTVTKPEPGEISVNIYFKKGIPQVITNEYYNLVLIKFSKKIKSINYKLNADVAEIFSPNKQIPWRLTKTYLGFSKNISNERMQ